MILSVGWGHGNGTRCPASEFFHLERYLTVCGHCQKEKQSGLSSQKFHLRTSNLNPPSLTHLRNWPPFGCVPVEYWLRFRTSGGHGGSWGRFSAFGGGPTVRICVPIWHNTVTRDGVVKLALLAVCVSLLIIPVPLHLVPGPQSHTYSV